MLLIVLAMLLIVVLAAGVVAYVAFPHRGEEMPGLPWLGDAMGRAAQSLPTLDENEQQMLHPARPNPAKSRLSVLTR